MTGPRTAARLTAAAVVPWLLVATGCGTAQDDAASPGTGNQTSPAATSELTVRVDLGPDRGQRRYSLTCDPAGGDHPRPEAACAALKDAEDPLAPVPSDAVCTEIYGGPQTARVTGTLEGREVSADFSRTNGCEIARWDRVQPLLVVRGGVDR